MSPLILSLETATTVCSVALHANGILLASSHVFIERSASSQLTIMIDDLLKRCARHPRQLDAVAVSLGPGSYTGLRVGVATAKGLCYSLGIPFIAANTLDVLVRKITATSSTDSLLCPMIDAGRTDVFCSLADSRGTVFFPMKAMSVESCSFDTWLADYSILFFGNGATKCIPIIENPNAEFVTNVYLSAVQVGEIALEKFVKKQFSDLSCVAPCYLASTSRSWSGDMC